MNFHGSSIGFNSQKYSRSLYRCCVSASSSITYLSYFGFIRFTMSIHWAINYFALFLLPFCDICFSGTCTWNLFYLHRVIWGVILYNDTVLFWSRYYACHLVVKCVPIHFSMIVRGFLWIETPQATRYEAVFRTNVENTELLACARWILRPRRETM